MGQELALMQDLSARRGLPGEEHSGRGSSECKASRDTPLARMKESRSRAGASVVLGFPVW